MAIRIKTPISEAREALLARALAEAMGYPTGFARPFLTRGYVARGLVFSVAALVVDSFFLCQLYSASCLRVQHLLAFGRENRRTSIRLLPPRGFVAASVHPSTFPSGF